MSNIDGNEDDDALKKEQESRTFLRERFLRSIMSITGYQAEIHLVNKRKVKCQFICSDIQGSRFHVSNLETPIGIQQQALLRHEDIEAVTVEKH